MPRSPQHRPIRKAVPQLIRRTPKQTRGQERVAEILDTTERLMRTTAWDALTTNHIAREAGVPIGSLYQFFANKEAIAFALVERYRIKLAGVFTQLPTQIETLTPAEVVNTIFDRVLEVAQYHLGLHALLIVASDDSPLGQIAAPIRDLLRANIEHVLALRAPWLNAEECQLHALVSHVTNRALFAQALSFMARGDYTRAQRLLQQARVIQIAYYDHLLREHEASHR